jgi:RNA recognition motif-containing protein
MVPVPYSEPQSPPVTQPEVPPAGPAVIKTEARKIIIRSLPHNTTTNELHDLLIKLLIKSRSFSGDPYQTLQDVEIARHSDQKSRGHAFAVFDTHQVAKDAVKALDGLKFQNRVLSSRLAKEGAEPAKRGAEEYVVPTSTGADRRYPLTAGPSKNSHREKGSRSGRREKDGERAASSERHRSSRNERNEGGERRHRTMSSERSKGRSDSFNTPLVVSSNGKEHR